MTNKEEQKIKDFISKDRSLVKANGKFYNKIKIDFKRDFLFIYADNDIFKIHLKGYSDKLYKASIKERMDYRVSPDNYGISWEKLNEDLSVKNLIRDGEKIHSNKIRGIKLKKHQHA